MIFGLLVVKIQNILICSTRLFIFFGFFSR